MEEQEYLCSMKPPFHLLFHNDLTNILTCVSPYHREGAGFDPAMLRAAVAESAATGAQTHLLQPGFCWVPWWPCRFFSFDEYRAWFAERFPGSKPLPHDYDVGLGGETDYHGFRLPRTAVVDGINTVRATLSAGPHVRIDMVDAILPGYS